MADPGAGAPTPEWLGRLAHDLRNPITPMRSAVQLLQLGQLPPELSADLLRTLDRQIDFLLRLIDDVADLVKVEKGTFAVQAGTCDLAAVVESAVARHARRAAGGKGGVPVEVEAPPTPILVRADEVRLRQLLETVLGCLGDSREPVPAATVALSVQGTHAVVRIVDSGRPFAANACLDFLATGAVPDDASALTLAHLVARRLLELHDASFAVVDAGAALELRLPLAATA